MANGDFSVSFQNLPAQLLTDLQFRATVVFTDPKVDPDLVDPMGVAYFAGTMMGLSAQGMRGYGMAYWLGDDESGQPYESAIVFNGVAPSVVFPALLPDVVLPGTIHDSGEVFVGHVGQYQLPRPAISYVASTLGVEWRVNPDLTFDAGLEHQLFTDPSRLLYPGADTYPGSDVFTLTVVPAAIVVAKSGFDVDLETLQGSMRHEADVEDYVTGVLVVGENLSAAIAEVDSTLLDPHGNPVRIIKVVSEPELDATNVATRAVNEIGTLTQTRNQVSLTVDDYHLTAPEGGVPDPIDVGTTVWVYDPDEGLFDTATPVQCGGTTVYPVGLRVLAVTQPVTSDTGVYVKNPDGWVDVTPYVQPETGSATLEVGATRRTLLNLSRQREAFRTRVALS